MSTSNEETGVQYYKRFLKGVSELSKKYGNVAYKEVKKIAKESVLAAKTQIDSEMKLESAMKLLNGATDVQIDSIKSYANQLQNLGVIGDEVQLSGARQLAAYRLQAETIEKLLPGINDLLAYQHGLNATQKDAADVGNLLAKAMGGQTDDLKTMGIQFSKVQEDILKYGSEAERAATLADVLNRNIGGVSQTLADTDLGSVQNLKNAWSDVKEQVGKTVIELQGKLAKWFVQYMPLIRQITDKAFDGVSKAIDNVSPYLSLVDDLIKKIGNTILKVKDWGVEAFNNMKERILGNQRVIEGVKVVIDDVKVAAQNLGVFFGNAFEGAQPILQWLKEEGLPGVANFITDIIDIALLLYNNIKDNWAIFEPMIYGIVSALAVYKIGMMAATLKTKLWALAIATTNTIALGLNNAMLIMNSSFGLIALGIGAAIAIGVLLYKNWDTIKEKALMLWESIKSIFGGVAEFFHQTFSSAFEGIVNFFTPAIDLINGVIEGLNKLNFKMPNLLGGKEFKINIPTISLPQFAMGTAYAREGFALIHERGGEIRYTSRGETIIPADKSKQMIEKINHGSNITININGSNLTAADVVNEMVPKLKLALSNM